jgi:hypothetical protein
MVFIVIRCFSRLDDGGVVNIYVDENKSFKRNVDH